MTADTASVTCRQVALLSPFMSNAGHWAVSAGNKFREVARTTENPNTKLLAEGFAQLSGTIRTLNEKPHP